MDDSQEQQLAQGLREGRIEAWHALYDAYAQPIWQAVARLLGPASADVADVVQETFLAAARSARSYDAQRGTLWQWLVGIARNHVALHFRKRERQERLRSAERWLAAGNGQLARWLEGCDERPWEAMASAELATLVRAALSELSAEYASLLTARYLDEVSIEQLADAERATPAAVRSKLARARRALREVLTGAAFVSLNGNVEGRS